MGFTNFPHGLTSFGIPLAGDGAPATFGTFYFVDYRNGSDGNTGKSTTKAFKTLSKAYTAVTSNANDVVIIDGDSTVVETAMVSLSSNRVHTIGWNGVPSPYGYGNGAKLSVAVTTAATDIATLQNTGVRNTFSNIKITNSNTVAEGLYAVADGGEYSRWFGCEFYKSTDLDEAGAAELLCNADSGQYINCTFGSLANTVSANGARPCVLFDRETLTGKVARDVAFYHCLFWRKCGDTDNRFMYGSGATDIERMGLVENCIFVNAALATQTPAQNIAFGASLTDGTVLVSGGTSINAGTAMSTTTGVFVSGHSPTAATACISIQAT